MIYESNLENLKVGIMSPEHKNDSTCDESIMIDARNSSADENEILNI